ncbi:MAG: flagellar biosynthesis anti-sigma factor FlgM [Acidovorax sp.]|uniref:flagellar biosynthesis anti-sigma factor FlgM n=1 Tax=Acidovorax sp. TaxID=1872122 RepID=UPI0039E3A053
MKIGQTPELPSLGASSGPAKQAKAPASASEQAQSAAAAASVAGVPVTVSTTVRSLTGSARLQGDFDADKVKSVRESIDNGTFEVDAEAIADKLLSNAQEQLSRQRG